VVEATTTAAKETVSAAVPTTFTMQDKVSLVFFQVLLHQSTKRRMNFVIHSLSMQLPAAAMLQI